MKLLHTKLSIPVIIFLGTSIASAQTIKEVVEHTMTTNPKIMTTLKNNQAYKLYIDEANGNYLPKLDLTAYVGVKDTKEDQTGADNKYSQQGFNTQLDFEQLIYDGGLTSGQISEAKYRFQSNKFLNKAIADDIIYESVDSYLNLVKYKNRVALSKEGLAIYDTYFTTAKETEQISGIALHKSQVSAKIHYGNNLLYQNQNNYLSASSKFKKSVGLEPDGKSCRPNIDNSSVPVKARVLVDRALRYSPKILEQIENIKEQRAILNQKDANFYPTLKFKAQALYDDDMLDENIKNTILSAKIELSYNLYNGGSNQSETLREKLFLEEAQKNLDVVTREVIDEVKTAYNSYTHARKREIELKKYIQDNEDILGFYKDQFEGGTRTFIDVLNVERDLISAKEELIDVQYEMDSAYYNIYKNLGSLKATIVNSNNDTCTQTKKVVKKVEPIKVETASAEVAQMLSEDTVKATEPVETTDYIKGTYAVYFIATKDTARTAQAVKKVESLVGPEYQVKQSLERGYECGVVYNLETTSMANEVKSKISSAYADSYIVRIK